MEKHAPTVTESEYKEQEWVEVDGVYIEHDVHRSRFLAHDGSGERPHLDYRIDASSHSMDIVHTFTPREHRGRGIAHAFRASVCKEEILAAQAQEG